MFKSFKKMNLPNKITMVRIALVPVFIILMVLVELKVWDGYMKYVAFGVYVIAALTDMLDGQISRRKKIVTKFGKIMDPLADKLLVSAGFIMLTGLNVIPAWITAIIVFRDFFVSALRVFGSNDGVTIAAVKSGKIKTIFQMLGISLAIIDTNIFGAFLTIGPKMDILSLSINVFMTVSVSLAVIATIWSLIDYLAKFGNHINVED